METTTKYEVTVTEVWDDEASENKVTITIGLSEPDNTYADYKPASITLYDDGLHGHYFAEYLSGLTFDFWNQDHLNTDLTKEDK
jgi:hypothetical protein